MDENQATKAALNQGSNFVWHELYTPKSAEAIEFYTTCLDFGSTSMDMGGGMTYTMLTRGGAPVCGLLGTTEVPHLENVPPHWATYLSVDDVDAKIELCKEHGATLVHGPMDVPTVGRMALIHDPAGAHIWLFKSA
jgi:uncharacterized protein